MELAQLPLERPGLGQGGLARELGNALGALGVALPGARTKQGRARNPLSGDGFEPGPRRIPIADSPGSTSKTIGPISR
jgi:hypothetical protein